MKAIQITKRAEADGKLRLEIPVDKVGKMYRVVVVLDELARESNVLEEWPSGYMDSVVGGWQGEFDRVSEGSFEQREPL
jgi:hypothetical protein